MHILFFLLLSAPILHVQLLPLHNYCEYLQ